MAESIAALSLAANILQFVEAGSKLLRHAWRIYRSDQEDDYRGDRDPLKIDFQQISDGLTGQQGSAGISNELEHLAKECRETASEFQDLLASIQHHASNGRPRKRDALTVSMKFAWKREAIRDLQQRIDQCRSQLTLHMINILRQESKKSLGQQKKLLDKLNNVLSTTETVRGQLEGFSDGATGFGTLLLSFLVSKAERFSSAPLTRSLAKELYHMITDKPERPISTVDETVISNERRMLLERKFISSLYTLGTEEREERIENAHSDTYQWIFEKPPDAAHTWADFRKWLRSDSGLYWITGKPGSGKSTLMKFICGSRRDEAEKARYQIHLDAWAANSTLLVSRFFFWNSGTSEQMSLEGCLRSLLHQLFTQYPGLIAISSPGRWEALCLFSEHATSSWTQSELQYVLESAVRKMPGSHKACIFIDGLDEMAGDEKHHQAFADLLKSLLRTRRIKICVASRPWNVFSDAFSQSPNLQLENFTYNDIKAFTTSTLHGDDNFALLRSREPAYAHDLAEKIISKAAGVFLWVNFVTRSLVAGISYGDRIVDLEKRLELLPPDLENLYDKIIKSLEPFYLEHTAQLFKLIESAVRPPSLLYLSFADEDACAHALKRPVACIQEEEIQSRQEAMRRRINSRTKGLLEAPRRTSQHDGHPPTVQYLHRTVRDFIRSQHVEKLFKDALESFFDPSLQLCAASLVYFKTGEPEKLTEDTELNPWYRTLEILSHASKAHRNSKSMVVALMDELDRTTCMEENPHADEMSLVDLVSQQQSLEERKSDFWTSSIIRTKGPTVFSGHFLSLAVRFGVVVYVEAKASPGCLVQPRASSWLPKLSKKPFRGTLVHSLLDDAVIPWCMSDALSDRQFGTVPDPDMVLTLLSKGANLNLDSRHYKLLSVFQPWEHLLEVIAAALSSGSNPITGAILMLSLRGKDSNTTVANFESLQNWKIILDVVIQRGLLPKNARKEAIGLLKLLEEETHPSRAVY